MDDKLDKQQQRINEILSRMEEDISNLEDGFSGLSDNIKLLKQDFSEFMNLAAETIADKINDHEKGKDNNQKRSNQ